MNFFAGLPPGTKNTSSHISKAVKPSLHRAKLSRWLSNPWLSRWWARCATVSPINLPPPATNNFYRAWRSPKKVLMQKSQKFCADFKYVNLKIELLQIFEKKSFSSLFLMRKPLSSDQKWFLRPYFPLIGGIFVLKSGLRFSFRAPEVPEPRVRKSPSFLRRNEKEKTMQQVEQECAAVSLKQWIVLHKHPVGCQTPESSTQTLC